jgi:hypothetical protein
VRQKKNKTESVWGAQVDPISIVKERAAPYTAAKIVIANPVMNDATSNTHPITSQAFIRSFGFLV